jgi:hypothetical protein
LEREVMAELVLAREFLATRERRERDRGDRPGRDGANHRRAATTTSGRLS